MSTLLIVDSPAVAHRVRPLLGPGWQVQAAPRHLFDLPRGRLGVAVSESFALSFQLPLNHQAPLKRLQKAAVGVEAVYLALGDDLSASGVVEGLHLPPETTVRVMSLDSLSAHAWAQALAGARPLDPKQVAAAKARRAADRLVAYLLTPLVSQRLGQPLKVDRLGLVMLSVLVAHEQRLNVPEKGHFLSAQLGTSEGAFEATLSAIRGKRAGALSKAQAEAIRARLSGAHFWVKTVLTREQPRPTPLSLASLMAQAEAQWGWTPARTGAIVRILFESGWITQGAVIRPTDPARLPAPDGQLAYGARLYGLIWAGHKSAENPVSTQRGVQIAVGTDPAHPFPLAWWALETAQQPLPPLTAGQTLSLQALECREAVSVPFSRGKLLSQVVTGGAGEALTCAKALERLESGGLVGLEGRALKPTELGLKLWQRLSAVGGSWVEGAVRFEQDCARIRTGELSYEETMERFWRSFLPTLQTLQGKGAQPRPGRPPRILKLSRIEEAAHG